MARNEVKQTRESTIRDARTYSSADKCSVGWMDGLFVAVCNPVEKTSSSSFPISRAPCSFDLPAGNETVAATAAAFENIFHQSCCLSHSGYFAFCNPIAFIRVQSCTPENARRTTKSVGSQNLHANTSVHIQQTNKIIFLHLQTHILQEATFNADPRNWLINFEFCMLQQHSKLHQSMHQGYCGVNI